MSQARKDGLSVLGIGVAACVACCAGPIFAFLGGVGLAGLASTVFFGATGLVIAAVALVALFVTRRRRNDCSVPNGFATPVATPTRRTTDISRRAQ